jgi:Flp pilus assembly protein TadG
MLAKLSIHRKPLRGLTPIGRGPQAGRLNGVATLYLVIMLTGLVGICSLGADYARVQLAKTEMQRAADAAARYAALGLASSPATARANAKTVALENTTDALPVVLLDSDIEMGTWNASTKTFTLLTGANEVNATAVRVTARRAASRGNAIPLTFGHALGRDFCDVKAASIVFFNPAVDIVKDIPSTSNPWLAGMPSGTVANPGNPHNNPDYAPTASPQQINGVPLVAGQSLTFDSIDGGANNFQSSTLYTPDGNTGWIVNNLAGNEHGKSNLTAPINAVVGVFLDDQLPTQAGPVPASLDFSTAASRDFQSLSPQLRQPFFIGDGKMDDGTTQTFVVPPGATRLYIGTMDGYEWNNNVGKYTTTIHRIPQVTVVK